jgi:hypothetical protein
MSIFRSVSMIDVLEQDPRPAFVLDLNSYNSEASDDLILNPIFCNKAFKEQSGLVQVVRGQSPPTDYGQPSASTYCAFAKWAVRNDVSEVPRGFICK